MIDTTQEKITELQIRGLHRVALHEARAAFHKSQREDDREKLFRLINKLARMSRCKQGSESIAEFNVGSLAHE